MDYIAQMLRNQFVEEFIEDVGRTGFKMFSLHRQLNDLFLGLPYSTIRLRMRESVPPLD